MSKIKPGGVMSDEPCGTTFTHGGTHAPTLSKGGTKPSHKIKAGGVESNEPQGTTFQGNKTHIKMGNADKAPSMTKVTKTGSGSDYVPNGKGVKYGNGGNGPSVKNPPIK